MHSLQAGTSVLVAATKSGKDGADLPCTHTHRKGWENKERTETNGVEKEQARSLHRTSQSCRTR